MSASDSPTLVSRFPSPPRVPTFVYWRARDVPEVRYDVVHATTLAKRFAGVEPVEISAEVYQGLTGSEHILLTDARCALVEAAGKLGWR